jgi:ribose 5-phosphate isomerase A
MDHDSEIDSLKRTAAESAAALVEDGMLVGLGTGSTAKFAVAAIGKRVQAGLRIVGFPTSGRTAEQARTFGIPLGTLAENTRLDLTIDGADEVETGSLGMIKGRGGALLREKIVASVSNRFAIVVDETKIVERLGRGPLPVEVVPFGWECTVPRLRDAGATPVLRLGTDGKPYLTDGGHYILDCMINGALSPDSLAKTLDSIVGLVEHGLFLGMATQVFVASPHGVKVLSR